MKSLVPWTQLVLGSFTNKTMTQSYKPLGTARKYLEFNIKVETIENPIKTMQAVIKAKGGHTKC